MNLRQAATGICSLLWRQIALSVCEHFITDHKFLDRRRPEQWRVEMGMELPMLLFTESTRRPVPTHRVGKGDFEQIIISCQKTLENIRQTRSFRDDQVRKLQHVESWNEQDLIRPSCPIGQ